jgi:2-(1,2-epoxy-1,2-dihydrophenyl)acetyl-CoA isomerase
MMRELHQVFDEIDADDSVRAVVMTGSGRGFCAGLDLSELDFTPGPGLLERADPGPVINEAFKPAEPISYLSPEQQQS